MARILIVDGLKPSVIFSGIFYLKTMGTILFLLPLPGKDLDFERR